MIMYMYYLLGWKGYISKNPQKMPFDNDNKRRFISDDNTYILALDGDTDFHPKAVVLLVDRLRMYYNVGAACGRIHPTGPMVWYQKFEYAVGHWLQKTAEHVFGSVLCSPGCFRLIMYGVMYFICIPSGYLLLTIYSLVNMNNVSWGTRESK
ncbi:hypothetical protein GOODEAATRI_010942 [Goodea atripinnis]|uniref:chitin synthase n=1 Tax=Goodea atripinnis TaxID=208336 RepID=A0ABV0PD54_9TELE